VDSAEALQSLYSQNNSENK